MSDDSFGFSASRKSLAEKSMAEKSMADKLKAIQPGQSSVPAPSTERVDRAGEALGFMSREPAPAQPPVVRRRREIGPTVAINTRAPERVAVPFIRFCEENRYSYWEGIEELMKRAGIA